MKAKAVISYITGFVTTGAIYFIVAYSVFLLTFNLSYTLEEKENAHTLYFYLILSLIIITVIVIYKQFKQKKRLEALKWGYHFWKSSTAAIV